MKPAQGAQRREIRGSQDCSVEHMYACKRVLVVGTAEDLCHHVCAEPEGYMSVAQLYISTQQDKVFISVGGCAMRLAHIA